MAATPWDALDPSELRRIRDRRLRRQVRFQLYAFSPFYRRTLDALGIQTAGFSGTEDLERLPLVDRAMLSGNPDDFMLQPSRAQIQRWGSGRQIAQIAFARLLRGIAYSDRELEHEYFPVHLLETTGTTGEPVPIRLSRRDLAVLATEGGRALEVAGVGVGDVMLNLLEPISAGGFWPLWAGAVGAGIQQVAPGMLEPENAAALGEKLRATVAVARADDALALLEASAERDFAFRTVVVGPEPLPPGLRARLSDAAGPGARVVSTYGFAEGRTVWAECAEGSGNPDAGFHLSGDYEIVEVISPRSGAPVSYGDPGEVAFTALDQRGTALARYRPGDVALGGLIPGRCPYCGRTTERIIGPIRRTENLLAIQMAGADPLLVDLDVLSGALAHPGVGHWRLEVSKADGDPRAPDEVFVLFAPRGRSDPASTAVDLDRALRQEAGFSPTQLVLGQAFEPGVADLRAAATH